MGEESPKGRWGNNTPMSGDVHSVLIFNHAALSEWGRKARMGLPEFTPVKNYKFLPGDPEMYNGDPVAKSLIL